MVWSTTSRALWNFNNDGQRVQYARPELPEPHYMCMYRLLPTTPPLTSRHYYPWLIAGTNLPISKGWIAWWAKADCTYITFAQGYYTIKSKGAGMKWTQVVRSKINSIPVNQLRGTLQPEKLLSERLGDRGIESRTLCTSGQWPYHWTAQVLLRPF